MELYKFSIPEESSGVFTENVNKLRSFEGCLRKIFYDEKYIETLMPTFEYVELYKSVYKNLDESTLFKYINKEGKDVALRWDFTVPIARYYISQKKDEIARYCYFGKVYRKEKEHKGKNSEIYQVGIELIGKKTIEGDVECISLLQKSLPIFGLKDLKIELGSASFYNRLCEIIGNERKEEFSKLLLQKNISGLKKFCIKYNLDERISNFIISLPRLNGNIEILTKTIEKLKDKELKNSLRELKELYETMNMKQQDLFDLACVPNMEYYTGIIFKVYSKYVEEPIISGGRYDKLYSNFGKDVSAIGMAYYMNNILKAVERAGEENVKSSINKR